MPARTIKLCEGHKGGFGMLLALFPHSFYRGTAIKNITVKLVEKDECIQCKANKRKSQKEDK